MGESYDPLVKIVEHEGKELARLQLVVLGLSRKIQDDHFCFLLKSGTLDLLLHNRHSLQFTHINGENL